MTGKHLRQSLVQLDVASLKDFAAVNQVCG